MNELAISLFSCTLLVYVSHFTLFLIGLFAFGERYGDTLIPQAVHGYSEVVGMTDPVVFYQAMEYSFYVRRIIAANYLLTHPLWPTMAIMPHPQ